MLLTLKNVEHAIMDFLKIINSSLEKALLANSLLVSRDKKKKKIQSSSLPLSYSRTKHDMIRIPLEQLYTKRDATTEKGSSGNFSFT